MYQSTDQLVASEQGTATKAGYQSVDPYSAGGADNAPANFLADVRKAKEDSKNCCDFCLTFFALLLGSIVWTIVLVITLTLPLVMIVIGAEYFNDCPAQRMIPIMLIVAGCVTMVSNIINLIDRFNRFRETTMPKMPTVIGWITTVLNIFLMAWFIAGCVWVFGIYKPNFERQNDPNVHYCNFTLYAFSFWLLNACFIFFGALVIVAFFGMCIALMCW